MTALLGALSLGLAVAVVLLATVLIRRIPGPPRVGDDTRRSLDLEPTESGVTFRSKESAEGVSRLAAVVGDDLELFTVEIGDIVTAGQEGPATSAAAVLLSPILQEAGRANEAIRAARTLSITFCPSTLARLASGELRLMQSARGSLSIVVDQGGRVVEHGTVVGGLASVGAAGLALGGLAAVAAAAYQVQVLNHLERIEKKVALLVDRSRHDDWGTLSAASGLCSEIQRELGASGVPDQFQYELSHAAMGVEQIYHSRMRAFAAIPVAEELPGSDEYERPEETRSASEESLLGRKDLEGIINRIGGDPSGFGEEVQLVLGAVLARAQVQTVRSVALVFDGHSEAAQRVLLDSRESTMADLGQLRDQLRTIREYGPGWFMTKINRTPSKVADFRALVDGCSGAVSSLQEELEAPTGPRELEERAPTSLVVTQLEDGTWVPSNELGPIHQRR